ncbi:hypothetical protein, conserved [Leishmania donovani]|uniref:Uncharacterized protein n=1 Tax=Leishmania donovani TaxID=5661 RepID=E9BCS4_LEIDO|nr:hypothetical protein, conserved [Leishmania donovani]CBZ33050.1 hypothetical protein, conserved [Leishmania donovani]
MQSRQYCRKPQPPPQPPRCSSAGAGLPKSAAYAAFTSSSLPSAALTPQHLHPSARMQPLGIPRQGGAPAASALTPPPAVAPSLSLPPDTTVLSVHSAASGNISRIGVRDVAELVRHLAESRYMTRQLQQRVHQMESFSSMKTAATGDSVVSGVPTQQGTTAASQAAGERLATSGEADAAAAVEQATPLHHPNQRMATSERRQRTANARGGEWTRTAARASAKAANRTRRVFAAFPRSRSRDSLSPRSPHRCPSTTPSAPATASTTASATTSSLPSTSPASSIAELPARCASRSPSSRCASNGACSTTPPRHRRRRASRRPYGSRRTHSALERPRQRPHSSAPANCRDTAADLPRKPEMQRRRGSAERRRTQSRSRMRRYHSARSSHDITLTAERGDGDACAAAHAASISLACHCPRSSATESRRHRRAKSTATQARHRVSFSSLPPPPAALPALDQMRGASSKKVKALVWQRRYYDLLDRYTDETTRRDADLADIHEMIEYISWEQDRSRHCHRQRHHAQTVEGDAGGGERQLSRVDATPRGSARGSADAPHAASDEHAVATPQAVAHTTNNGTMRTKADDGGPGGSATVSDAVAPVHDSLECIEALRCEADAWRQRCLALLQQQQKLQQPQQRLEGEVTWARDTSVAPLPPRPSSVAAGRSPLTLGTGSTSRQVELLMSTHTSTTADEGAGVTPGGGHGECEGDACTAAAHLTENAVHGRASPPALPSYPTTPASMVAQTPQCASPSATPAAAAGDASSPGLQLYHPYAPPRLATSSHVSSVGAANFDSRFPTPPLPSHARQPVQPAGGAPSPPTGFSSPMASPLHTAPAKPPLFVGVPGYQPLSTRHDSRAAWPSQAFPASLPSGKAPPYGTSADYTFPAAASAFHGAPSFDASDASAWRGVTRGGAPQGRGYAASSASPWSIDATLEHQRHSNLPASSPTAVPEALTPYPHASSLLHVPPPSLSMAAELVCAREQLERDIRRHDQLLAAIGKLQKTAAEHATRRGL